MQPFLDTALREAGRYILKSLPYLSEIKIIEKSPNDFATKVDIDVERLLISHIQKMYPMDAICAEESGWINEANHDRVWIIDPLDGSRNFIQCIPHYAISVALRVKGVVVEGAIYDPFKDEMFEAIKGEGAKLNGKKIRVYQAETLKNSIIGIGFPFRHTPEIREKYFAQLAHLLPQCADVRRSGSAALDLAYVAAGRLDGYWEHHLHIWDIAAGALIVKEAGGLVADFQGGERYLETGDIVVGNPRIFKALLQTLAKAIAE